MLFMQTNKLFQLQEQKNLEEPFGTFQVLPALQETRCSQRNEINNVTRLDPRPLLSGL